RRRPAARGRRTRARGSNPAGRAAATARRTPPAAAPRAASPPSGRGADVQASAAPPIARTPCQSCPDGGAPGPEPASVGSLVLRGLGPEPALLEHPRVPVRIGEAGEARVVAAVGIQARGEAAVPGADRRL